MRTTRFIDPTIFNFIISADKMQLLKMRNELSKEIEEGTLTDLKYKKELELINERLGIF